MTWVNEFTYYGVILTAFIGALANAAALHEIDKRLPTKLYAISLSACMMMMLAFMSMNSPTQYLAAYDGFEIACIRVGLIIFQLEITYLAVSAIKYVKVTHARSN